MSGGHHLLSVGCEGGDGDGDGSVACKCDAIGKAILLEACFGDKRWVGWGVRPWGGRTCRCPGVLRASGTGKGAWYLHCMTRSRILYNVTQNNSGVEDPQYLSDLAYF